MKALLHCGTFKTGSTTIQNTAWHSQTALKNAGILYPCSGIDHRAAREDGAIGFRHSRFVYEYGQKSYQPMLAELGQEIRSARAERLFLSAEPWSNPKALASLKAMVEHLNKQGVTELRGLVFIRNARDYMVRHYREWIRRHGAAMPFQPYILSRKFFFDYLTLCKNIKAIFKGQVDFVAYDTTKDVGRHTFEQLGIDYETLQRPAQTNVGLSCLDIEIRRTLNEYGLRMPSPPDAQTLLNRFGLQAQASAFSEALPGGFLDVYDAAYIREFSSVTGINHATARSIFKQPENQGVDIASASPILEKVIFEWLKNKRRQAS